MNKPQMTKNEAYQKYLSAGRSNILLIIILTVVNIMFYLIEYNYMLLFSASIPLYSVVFGEVYTEVTGSNVYLITGLVIAAAFITFLIISYALSKNKVGFVIATLVVMCIDTVATIGFNIFIEDATGILDVLIHIAILVYLSYSIYFGIKMKNLPDEIPLPTNEDGAVIDTQPIRLDSGFSKTIFETVTPDGRYCISCKKAGTLRELVINGHVYAECMFANTGYELIAVLDGQLIKAGLRPSSSKVFISAGNQTLLEKFSFTA